jgi:hypothetical protein
MPAEDAAYWRRLARSAGNRDALTVLEAFDVLLERIDAYVEAHGPDCYCAARDRPDDEGRYVGRHMAGRLQAMAETLELYRGAIDSEVVEPDDDEAADPADRPLVAAGR